MKVVNIITCTCLAICLGCAATAEMQAWSYPEAPTVDVVDDYHGTLVADPYRWLEDPDSGQTLAWVEAENKLTHEYLSGDHRDAIHERLTQLWDYPRWSVPVKEGDRYFYSYNDGLMDQPLWYVQDDVDAEPRTLLDPNQLSEDGTSAVTSVEPSRDGRLLAYTISVGGSDWQELHIRDVDSGQDLDDVLHYLKFSSIAWHPDSQGFYYNRFPDPETVKEEDRNRYNRVYFHQLGTSQEQDLLVYEDPSDPDLGFAPWIPDGGRYLILYVYRGTDPKSRIYLRKLEESGPFTRLLDQEDALYNPLGIVDGALLVHTDADAPRGRIVAMDLEDPSRDQWREVVGQRKEVIDHALLAGDRLVVAYMQDAHDLLSVFGLEGTQETSVDLPGIGSVAGIQGTQGDPEVFFAFMSYLDPPSIMRYDLASGEFTVFAQPQIEFDRDAYETVQVFYESGDGTRIPMFITHKKEMELDGGNPTLLYGYGGFNISITPRFRAHYLLWLENGGVLAVANIRGGNEYGEQWHQQGILENKQNVFDDFIAAAEWLVAEGYTSSRRLGIMGGSNGGLLTAACMLQRPDLFGAVVSAVPVIDMLRYHKFTVGHYWVSDYGNAEESPEHFQFLYAYSPLHNIEPGVVHPPTLVTTADTDDRVVPMHGKKFVAALQAVDPGVNPILLRVETKAGHGKGKPTSKSIDEMADIYTFLFKNLGLPPPLVHDSP